jgi:hypothetical protein
MSQKKGDEFLSALEELEPWTKTSDKN